ncbi:MAG: glutaredoxin family protein [Gammaproteobacteria bacterium]|nr:glutaredoxin family protein [Gammaproteobacteria bacterium]
MIDELLPLIDGKARLEIVDISGDPELVDKYDIRIPVLACGDIELATYELDRDKLAGFLERS